MMHYRQRFYILDPNSFKPVGEKARSAVHKEGDWHRATNVFIVRQGKSGEPEVLVQRRSTYVDIARYKLDQSLATQVLVEDGGDTKQAVERGLREELGLLPRDIKRICPFNNVGSLRIAKRYTYNRDLWNREVIMCYGVVLRPGSKPSITCEKIKDLQWVSWDKFIVLLRTNPNMFTKTSRLFCTNAGVVETVTRFLEYTLLGKNWQPFAIPYVYVSLYDYDVLGLVDSDNCWNFELYLTRGSMKFLSRISGVKSLIGSKMLEVVDDDGLFSLLTSVEKNKHNSFQYLRK